MPYPRRPLPTIIMSPRTDKLDKEATARKATDSAKASAAAEETARKVEERKAKAAKLKAATKKAAEVKAKANEAACRKEEEEALQKAIEEAQSEAVEMEAAAVARAEKDKPAGDINAILTGMNTAPAAKSPADAHATTMDVDTAQVSPDADAVQSSPVKKKKKRVSGTNSQTSGGKRALGSILKKPSAKAKPSVKVVEKPPHVNKFRGEILDMSMS